MAYKFVVALAFVAVASAAIVVPDVPVLRTAAPVAVAPAPVLAKTVELEEYDPHPQYKYGYDVQDALSGDSKGHVEERDGDVVRGEYSLTDADGFRRTVTYTADPVNGFNAVVRREPIVAAVVAPAPIVRAAPLVKAAPVAVAAPVAAPLVRAAPAAYAAPVAAPLVRAAPAAYAAPVVAPAAYAAPALVRSAPLVGAPLSYAAPAFAYRQF